MVQYRSLDFLGFPSYRVGDDGSISRWLKHKKMWKQLRFGSRRNHRISVILCKPGIRTEFRVAAIVLAAFVGPRPSGLLICHNDDNSSHDSLANLRYDTAKNNQADRIRHGTSNHGERNCGARLSSTRVVEVRALHANGMSYTALATRFGVTSTAIGHVIRGKTWTHV